MTVLIGPQEREMIVEDGSVRFLYTLVLLGSHMALLDFCRFGEALFFTRFAFGITAYRNKLYFAYPQNTRSSHVGVVMF